MQLVSITFCHIIVRLLEESVSIFSMLFYHIAVGSSEICKNRNYFCLLNWKILDFAARKAFFLTALVILKSIIGRQLSEKNFVSEKKSYVRKQGVDRQFCLSSPSFNFSSANWRSRTVVVMLSSWEAERSRRWLYHPHVRSIAELPGWYLCQAKVKRRLLPIQVLWKCRKQIASCRISSIILVGHPCHKCLETQFWTWWHKK